MSVMSGQEYFIFIVFESFNPRVKVGWFCCGLKGIPRSAARKTLASSAFSSSLA
jgi:hypothetical protein